MKTLTESKLTLKTKLGYGVASIADAIAYDFVATFFLFFLTDVAGISPAFAGTIILLGVVWDGISDPLIGMLSDRSRSKYGKKRPFLLISAIPLGIAMALLFIAVDFEGVLRNLYFLVIAIIFWTSYTAFNIPYYALGGCISYDNDDRVQLSSVRQIFNYLGLFSATALPTMLIGLFLGRGLSDKSAWSYTAMILGALTIVTILITWRATRGKEQLGCEDEEPTSFKDTLKSITSLLKMKSYLIIILSALFYYISYTFLTSSLMFMTTYVLGSGEVGASLLFVTVTVSGIIFAALLGKFAVKFDKRNVYITCLSFTALVMIITRFIPNFTMTTAIIYVVLYSVGSASFWTLIYNFVYDTVDLDEFVNGSRREGLSISFFGLFVKIAAALAAQMSGLILQFSGYLPGAETQPESALSWIKSLFTIIPGVFMLLAALIIILFPLTRKKHDRLMNALELKREGKEYGAEGLEDFMVNGVK